jgi:hypothetical protein
MTALKVVTVRWALLHRSRIRSQLAQKPVAGGVLSFALIRVLWPLLAGDQSAMTPLALLAGFALMLAGAGQSPAPIPWSCRPLEACAPP